MNIVAIFLLLAQFVHHRNPGVQGGAPPTIAASGACPGPQCVSLSTEGVAGVLATITASGSCPGGNCTLTVACTKDNWATNTAIPAYTVTNGVPGGVPSITVTAAGTYAFPATGFPLCGVYPSSYTSGTATVYLDGDPAFTIPAATVAKGTQGTAAAPVQELKDAGRSSIVINVDAATPAGSDTLLTFQKNVDGTATGSLTSLAVTSGKTFRLQDLECSYVQSGVTAAKVDVRFRRNNAGACTAGSGLVASCEMGPQLGTAAANEGADHCRFVIPDGYEIFGDGTKSYCLSAIASSSAGTLSCNIFGFEY